MPKTQDKFEIPPTAPTSPTVFVQFSILPSTIDDPIHTAA